MSTYSPDVDYKKLDRRTVAYATSLAAELRKRRMQLELKSTVDVRPRPKNNRSRNKTVGRRAEEPVIIIDDLSSPEDEANPIDAKDKCLSVEPDAKKQKMETSDVVADDQTLPAPIVDDALLSSIPMPSLPSSASAVAVKQQSSPPVVEEKQHCSPPVVDEKLSPVLSSPPEQHSAPVNVQTTSPANIDQAVSTCDASYAFRLLTELPMPPVATDDDYESPAENCR